MNTSVCARGPMCTLPTKFTSIIRHVHGGSADSIRIPAASHFSTSSRIPLRIIDKKNAPKQPKPTDYQQTAHRFNQLNNRETKKNESLAHGYIGHIISFISSINTCERRGVRNRNDPIYCSVSHCSINICICFVWH